MLEDEKQHPAVMALNDKRDIEEKLSLPMGPMETASAFKIRHEEGLQEYSDFVESKRFPDGERAMLHIVSTSSSNWRRVL